MNLLRILKQSAPLWLGLRVLFSQAFFVWRREGDLNSRGTNPRDFQSRAIPGYAISATMTPTNDLPFMVTIHKLLLWGYLGTDIVKFRFWVARNTATVA